MLVPSRLQRFCNASAGTPLLPSAVGIALWFGALDAAAQSPPPVVGPPEPPNLLQAPPGQRAQAPGSSGGGTGTGAYAGGTAAGKLLGTPVSSLSPGNVPIRPNVKSPVADDPQAAARGMQYFVSLNCVGCHAPNAGGGMGPALSNSFFIYGSEPANIYLSIYQGRPRGMPAWGALLSDTIVWDLVAYIQSISKEPAPQWGTTVSLQTMQVEQVPAEYANTPTPWERTETFSRGQKPNTAK